MVLKVTTCLCYKNEQWILFQIFCHHVQRKNYWFILKHYFRLNFQNFTKLLFQNFLTFAMIKSFFIFWQNDIFRVISYFFHNDSHFSKKIIKNNISDFYYHNAQLCFCFFTYCDWFLYLSIPISDILNTTFVSETTTQSKYYCIR